MTPTLAGPVVGARLHAVGSVESTQTVLARLAAAGAPEGTVVHADHQTAGRGRRGRAWWDAPGQSVLASVLLRPPMPLAQAAGLSLVVAVAAAEALDAFGAATRIRWPNDLVVGERKLGGILCEAAAGPPGEPVRVLVGCGINVGQATLPPELAAIATSLRIETGRTAAVADVLGALLAALDRRYRAFREAGLADALPEWRRRSATLGRRVRTPDGEALAADVDADGALLVTDDAGRTRRLSAGEIAHVAAP